MIICKLLDAEFWYFTTNLALETDSNVTISRFSINIHCIPCLRNFLLIFFVSSQILCFICVTEWNEKNSLWRIRKVIFCCQFWMYFYFSVFLNATKMFHFKQTLLPDSSKDKRIFTRPKHVEHKTSKKVCLLLYFSEGLILWIHQKQLYIS